MYVRPWVMSRLCWVLCAFLLASVALFASLSRDKITQIEGEKSPLPAKFYHWKTFFEATKSEERIQASFKDAEIYLRLFDVVKQENGGLVPVATVLFREKPMLPVVPVIYIDNEALRQLPDAGVDSLADKITGRVQKILDENHLNYRRELQLDCDWTPQTQERFFALLKRMRVNLPQWALSSTLRLHQLRYPEKTGIPPVDRVCLMAYNMGELRTYGDHNSILDVDVAARYLNGSPYPLPLDVALPLFSWAVVFDSQKNYQRLLREIPTAVNDPKQFKPIGRFLYQAIQNQSETGGHVQAGNVIRVERSKKEDLRALAKLIARSHIKPEAVLFYHLDNEIIEEFGVDEIIKIMGFFR